MNILKKSVFTKCHIKVLEAGFDLLALDTDIKLAKTQSKWAKVSFSQPPDIPFPPPRFYSLEY